MAPTQVRVSLDVVLMLCFHRGRFALSSMDMEQRDYDSRTALHVAAAEGYKLSSILAAHVCVLVSHAHMCVLL